MRGLAKIYRFSEKLSQKENSSKFRRKVVNFVPNRRQRTNLATLSGFKINRRLYIVVTLITPFGERKKIWGKLRRWATRDIKKEKR